MFFYYVPNLRFSEFNDEWKEITLKKCCISLEYGLGVEAIEFDGINKYIRITDIDEQTNKYNNFPVSPKGNLDDKYLVKENDILLARTGASVGKPYIYNTKDGKLYFAGFLIRARINPLYRSKFVFFQFLTNKYKKWVKIMSTRSGQPGINSNEYAQYKFRIPLYKEQYKIEKFLSLIEEKIDTQNKIIKDLETLKNQISLFIFGDKSEIKKKWKLVKLFDVLKERKTYAIKESIYPHVTLSKDGICSKGKRYNRDFLVKDEEKNYKITHLNDICYNPANLKFGVICLNNYGDAIFSPIYVTYVVKSGNDPYFIAQYVTNATFIDHIRKYEQGTVYERMAVSSEDFLKGKIYLPDYQTQLYISKMFKTLDVKINMESKVLEKYKEQKKYLLSNMFI